MRRVALFLSLAGIALALTQPAAAASKGEFAPAPEGSTPVPGRYLVELEEGAVGSPPGLAAAQGVAELSAELARGYDFRIRRLWSAALTGFQAEMTEGEARRLARHPFVKRVQQDYSVQALSTVPPECSQFSNDPVDSRTLPAPSGSQWNQTITCTGPTTDCIDNWGLDRIDQRSGKNGGYVASYSGAGTYVVLFDTGVNNHREWQNLAGVSRVSTLSRSFVTADPNAYQDGTSHGHGTHVTGIAAGRTYGVAKLANIVMVRVCQGNNCLAGDIVSGLNYVAGLKATFPTVDAVASLSANNAVWRNDSTLVTAVSGLINAGVQLIQSAGNDGGDACTYSFGQVSSTFVVAGTDFNDARFNFGGKVSNYGTCVDLFAPAQQIVSASRKATNKYCMLTGTSMAAPHVAGAVAHYLERNPGASPVNVRTWLINQATTGAVTNPGPGSPNRLLYLPF